MTGPLFPPNDPGSPTGFPPSEDAQDDQLAPSIFFADYTFPPPGTVVVPPLPRSSGGVIQAIKTGTVQGLRDALTGTSLFDKDQRVYVSLEYPMQKIQYPGMWVQFSVSKLNRAGIGHEITKKIGDNWVFIQEWMVEGRVTITVVALSSLDRDRLSDAVIVSLAFARPPDLVLSNRAQDTKQNRGFITALDENPYIAVTLQLDTLIPGGQQVTQGTPWGDDAALVYEDSYSFDLVGNFNLQYSQDGIYTLSEIIPNVNIIDGGQPYSPPEWLDAPSAQPVNPAQVGGWVNQGNTDTPAM